MADQKISYQNIFKRYELKYLVTKEQKELLLAAMAPYIEPDEYGRSLICSLYFDTPDYLLARRSLERPVYKEKLRLRSYGVAAEDGRVFIELKKKYQGVVYKRRVDARQREAMDYLCGDEADVSETGGRDSECEADSWDGRGEAGVSETGGRDSECEAGRWDSRGETDAWDSRSCGRKQILREIDYFKGLYRGLEPKVYLSYEREAFCGLEDPGLRITFDENILWRGRELSLCAEPYGRPVLESGRALMEVKTSYAMPIWLCRLLSEYGLFAGGFSKYGSTYRQIAEDGAYRQIVEDGVSGVRDDYGFQIGWEAKGRPGSLAEDKTEIVTGGKKYA